MKNTEEKVVAVIMVGGPTKGTRFRPLSFNTPKPLFPLAGQPMVHHPISACKSIPNLARIFLVGFHEEREFALYVSSISSELNIPVRYLKEDKPHGSAGDLYYFKDLIMEDNPSHIVLLNCDVCCSFPLPQMLDAHRSYGGMGTLLVIKVSAEFASELSKKGTENHHLHQEIRTTAMSCIEGLSTLWPHVSKSGGKNGRSAVWSHFLGDVLAMMVQQKKLILSDRDFLSEFFTTLLRSGHHSLLVPQSVGESFDQPKKDSIMKFILSSALLLCPYGVVFWI